MVISVMMNKKYPENLVYDIVGRKEDELKEVIRNMSHEDLINAINEMFKTVIPRHAKITEMRYREGKTFKELGEIFGVSKSRITQIVYRTLRLLRHPKRITALYGEEITINKNKENLDFKTFLYNLGLSTKTYNSLKRANFVNREDFEGRNAFDFHRIRGIGPKVYTEIKQKLGEKGIKINEEV